ncbi:MAG: hypothetical protein ACI4NE_03965 [Succinivibrio sp.]
MDLKYLVYCFKCIFFTGFKFSEYERVLNSLTPEITANEYVTALKFNKEHEKRLRVELRKLIDDAYASKIPLGIEKFEYEELEDSYLRRQQYLVKFQRSNEFKTQINKFVALILISGGIVVLLLIANHAI